MQAPDVIEKIQEHAQTLVNRKWTDIQRILENEGEVKLTFGSTITDRDTDPGQQADKSNRIKTTISFSERYTDTIECELDGHPQLDFSLSGPVHTPSPAMPTHDEDGNELANDANLSSPGAVDAGATPLGEALDQAASQTDQPLLDIALNDPGWTVGGLRAEVKTKAGKKPTKWSAPALSLLVGLIDACGDDLAKVKATIRPHTVAGQTAPVEQAATA